MATDREAKDIIDKFIDNYKTNQYFRLKVHTKLA